MKTSILEKPKQESDVDGKVISLSNVVPSVPLNHTRMFNLVYDFEGSIIKDVRLIPKDSLSEDYSMIEMSVDSNRKILPKKVKSIVMSGEELHNYFAEFTKDFEPYEKVRLDYSGLVKAESRSFGETFADKVILETIKAYNALK